MSASAIAKRMAETLLPAQMGRNKHGRESMLKVHNESGDVIDDLFFCLPAAQRATAQLGGSSEDNLTSNSAPGLIVNEEPRK